MNQRVEMGQRLKALREANNMTRADLSERLGLSVTFIGQVESGARSPKVFRLIELSYIFKVSIDYILGVDKKRNV